MTKTLTLTCTIAGQRRRRSNAQKPPTAAAVQPPLLPPGRVPRLARLMALALRCDQLLQRGELAHYQQLAELAHVTRARISQILSLVQLAPDIQEEILFLPLVEHGPDALHLGQVQPIARVLDWRQQRRLWRVLRKQHETEGATGGAH